jgi:PUA domain protein
MPQRYRRHFLKAKEAKSVFSEASKKLKADFGRIFEDRVEMELVETDFCELFLIKGRPLLVRIEKKILPTLVFSESLGLMPEVVVDMGAVPHVCNGADIMAPGIVLFEGEFRKGDLVRVVDEKHYKTIAVGTANLGVDSAKEAKRGAVIQNIHFVGDKIWNLIKKLENL